MGNAKNARIPENGSRDPNKVRFGSRAFWQSEGKVGESEMRDRPTVNKAKHVLKGVTMVADAASTAASLVPGLGLPVLAANLAYRTLAPEGSQFHSKGPAWQKAASLGAGLLGGYVAHKAIGALANSAAVRQAGEAALKTVGRGQAAVGSALGKVAPAVGDALSKVDRVREGVASALYRHQAMNVNRRMIEEANKAALAEMRAGTLFNGPAAAPKVDYTRTIANLANAGYL